MQYKPLTNTKIYMFTYFILEKNKNRNFTDDIWYRNK